MHFVLLLSVGPANKWSDVIRICVRKLTLGDVMSSNEKGRLP